MTSPTSTALMESLPQSNRVRPVRKVAAKDVPVAAEAIAIVADAVVEVAPAAVREVTVVAIPVAVADAEDGRNSSQLPATTKGPQRCGPFFV